MDQHVISAWLLRAFAGRGRGPQVVHVYDKANDTYGVATVAEFLAEVDAHTPDVELDIGRLEDPAARAARNLVKRTRALPGGFYAVVGLNAAVQTEGPAITDEGVFQGMRILVSRHELPSPTDVDRLALANYAGFMYQRAPKVEAALIQFGIAYDQAAQFVLDQLMPGMRSGLGEDVSARRARMLRNARNIGRALAPANWWVARAGAGEAFVLGDNPVPTTVSLGHDDSWRPILAQETYVVVMPLGPAVALVIAPRILMPTSDIEGPDQIVAAINRLVWRSAARYVVARDREQLERAMPGADEQLRRSIIPVDWDPDRVVRSAIAQTVNIITSVTIRHAAAPWLRWEGCRLLFGDQPFATEDRARVRDPPHALSTPPSAARRALRDRRSGSQDLRPRPT